MEDAEEDAALYAWEGIYERPWEAVVEASDGSLRGAAARRRYAQHALQGAQRGVRRAVMRSLLLVVDCSRAAGAADAEMRPSRLAAMADTASAFVTAFFDQNPISTLGLLVMRNGQVREAHERKNRAPVKPARPARL